MPALAQPVVPSRSAPACRTDPVPRERWSVGWSLLIQGSLGLAGWSAAALVLLSI